LAFDLANYWRIICWRLKGVFKTKSLIRHFLLFVIAELLILSIWTH
jgi:hypothetical protein